MVMAKSFAKKMAAGSPWVKKISHNAKKKRVNIRMAPYHSLKMAVWRLMGTGKAQTVVTNQDQWQFITVVRDLSCCLSQLANAFVAEESGREPFQLVCLHKLVQFQEGPIAHLQLRSPMGTTSPTPMQGHPWPCPFLKEASTKEEPLPDIIAKKATS